MTFKSPERQAIFPLFCPILFPRLPTRLKDYEALQDLALRIPNYRDCSSLFSKSNSPSFASTFPPPLPPYAPSNRRLLFHGCRTCGGDDEQKTRREKRGRRRNVVFGRMVQAQLGKKPSAACVLSCVVGNGPPARTTSHRYLLVSVSLGGKSISFRRYCAHLFVQNPRNAYRVYVLARFQLNRTWRLLRKDEEGEKKKNKKEISLL